MNSFVVITTLSDRFKQAYKKAISEANAGGAFSLPEDIGKSRDDHNAYLEKLKESGKLFCAGPFDDFESALLIFQNTPEDEVRRIMAEEPHTSNGFFTVWEVREWHHRF